MDDWVLIDTSMACNTCAAGNHVHKVQSNWQHTIMFSHLHPHVTLPTSGALVHILSNKLAVGLHLLHGMPH
jgi:hypothetical protein